MHLGQPGDRAQQHILDARLLRCGHRHTVAVAAQTRGNPQDMYIGYGRGFGDATDLFSHGTLLQPEVPCLPLEIVPYHTHNCPTGIRAQMTPGDTR